MARILIIEDDSTIRQGIEYALRRAGYKIKSLETGTGAPELISEYAPDLIILDLMLPGLSGFEIAEAVRERDDETAIIMISALGEDNDKIAGFALGADDYLCKPFSTDELLARVKANLRRVRPKELLDEKEILRIGDLIIDPASFAVTVADKPIALRSKEFALLYALARNQGNLSTRETLAKQVWGHDHLPSSRTIDVHIRRLRALIEESSNYSYIQTIHGKGYRFIASGKDDSPHE